MFRFLPTFALLVAFASPVHAEQRWHVVDASTLIAPDGRKIRVLGVSTPVPFPRARCAAEDKAASAAKSYATKALVSAGKVELIERGMDKYRRTLAVVLIDGKDLADLLIKAGHGRLKPGDTRDGWC